MSIWGRRISVQSIVFVAVIFVMTLGVAHVLMQQTAREVTLVARGMAFYLEGEPETPNPIINARPGETVRIVLKNHDRGMTHDFTLPAVDASTDVLDWNEEDAITFEVPTEPGAYEYVCRPHLLMMKGTLKVSR
jgi:plastocyanin